MLTSPPNVSLSEIFAHIKQRTIMLFCDFIRKAIAIVQSSRMNILAPSAVGVSYSMGGGDPVWLRFVSLREQSRFSVVRDELLLKQLVALEQTNQVENASRFRTSILTIDTYVLPILTVAS